MQTTIYIAQIWSKFIKYFLKGQSSDTNIVWTFKTLLNGHMDFSIGPFFLSPL
jgi:hypothetical protein